MIYNNVLYLKYSEVVYKENQNYYTFSFNKKIYNKGIIINNDAFAKQLLIYLNKNKLSNLFSQKKIKIIYNSQYSNNDLTNLYNLFVDLNYKIIELVNEKNYFSLNSKKCYLLVDTILSLFYLDKYNSKKVLNLDPDLLYLEEIKNIISKRILNKTLYIIGNLPNNFLEDNWNYYIYENINEFFLENNLLI